MTDPSLVAEAIRRTLVRMPLAPSYASEQRDLQPDVQRALEGSLRESFPGGSLVTIISVGGTGKPRLSLLGTRFWPDVEIRDGTTPVAAIEVKLIRSGHPPSKAIAEAIGQVVIYSIGYPRVFTFIVHYGRSNDRYHDEDAELVKRLSAFNVELILRTAPEGVA